MVSNIGGIETGEATVGLELGVGLALAVGDGPEIVVESGQLLLIELASAAMEGIDGGMKVRNSCVPLRIVSRH